MTRKYPQNSIIDILNSDLVTEPTRKVLQERLDVSAKHQPDFFSENEYTLLVAVSQRLLPQDEVRKIDLPGLFDSSLAEGNGNGWRYDLMPPDEESYRKGLAGIEESAKAMFNASFITIAIELQDEVLTAIQDGKAPGKIWESLPSALFFEELLASLTELYYSHPYGREEIGDLSVADKPGWQQISLNHLEPREPKAYNSTENNMPEK